ncbi:MAG: hypothetical protein LUB63_06805 [Oscillospiraceae bacterium]|nr:hypothetical protein [Oscillospiraceae bacterium]
MKQPWRRLCLAAALVLAYLLLLVGGALLVCIYPARRQSDYVVKQAAAIAQADPAEREERISLATGANFTFCSMTHRAIWSAMNPPSLIYTTTSRC